MTLFLDDKSVTC